MLFDRHFIRPAAIATIGFLSLSGVGGALVAPATASPATGSVAVRDHIPSHAQSVLSGNVSNFSIYRDSQGWEWLSNPGMIVPGGKINNITRGGACSVGWIVGRGNRIFILTAGHCGKRGDEFAMTDRYGNAARVGQMVASVYLTTGNLDFGLIEIYRQMLGYVRSIPFQQPLTRWERVAWLDKNAPRVCHLGWRSGQSCGAYMGSTSNGIFYFEGIGDHGDSGGPVYSVINNQVHALGIISHGYTTNATTIGVQSIEPAMDYWGPPYIGSGGRTPVALTAL